MTAFDQYSLAHMGRSSRRMRSKYHRWMWTKMCRFISDDSFRKTKQFHWSSNYRRLVDIRINLSRCGVKIEKKDSRGNSILLNKTYCIENPAYVSNLIVTSEEKTKSNPITRFSRILWFHWSLSLLVTSWKNFTQRQNFRYSNKIKFLYSLDSCRVR